MHGVGGGRVREGLPAEMPSEPHRESRQGGSSRRGPPEGWGKQRIDPKQHLAEGQLWGWQCHRPGSWGSPLRRSPHPLSLGLVIGCSGPQSHITAQLSILGSFLFLLRVTARENVGTHLHVYFRPTTNTLFGCKSQLLHGIYLYCKNYWLLLGDLDWASGILFAKSGNSISLE